MTGIIIIIIIFFFLAICKDSFIFFSSFFFELLSMKIQAASQGNLEQLQEKNNASIRSQMELRIKDLESELAKVKTFQEDSNTGELENISHFT